MKNHTKMWWWKYFSPFSKVFIETRKINIFRSWECDFIRWLSGVRYTIHKKNTLYILNMFFRTKQTLQAMQSFFFWELQLITVLLLILDSYTNWRTRFISLKLCVRFTIFDSLSFLLKFLFLFCKNYGLFDFKTS